ncbi:hypothetical protein C1646_710725 [Rhizophagus diaphanus]|nr:hypothetical protein C1646_710725 [Rhizophagus diaphanus] [Rhizophagus sp. MUCL 43196]
MISYYSATAGIVFPLLSRLSGLSWFHANIVYGNNCANANFVIIKYPSSRSLRTMTLTVVSKKNFSHVVSLRQIFSNHSQST